MRCLNFFSQYPVSIWFILGNELCERFNYYGMRTILVIYLKTKLDLSEDTATMIYHVFTFFSYFFPLFGAILADSFIGRFNTILYLSLVYACGSVLIATGSAFHTGLRVGLSLLGLSLIAVGSGGIKPCVSAFGGCQFNLPAQQALLSSFFGIFYFCINFGSLFSTFLTPMLKSSSICGSDECYPAAFGLPAFIMCVATVLFIIGRPWYRVEKLLPERNVMVMTVKCINHAVGKRITDRKNDNKKEHWLDFADDKYDASFIGDVKQVLHVLFLFIPIPFFWALYDQQASRWTFQALSMYGGFFNEAWMMDAEQMQIWNPLMILALIPFFQYAVYPLFAKCRVLETPLQRMCVGMLLAALAFVVSAVVEGQVESNYAVVPGPGTAQLRIFNGLPCSVEVQADIPSTPGEDSFLWTRLESMSMWQLLPLSVTGEQRYKLELSADCSAPQRWSHEVDVKEGEASMYLMTGSSGGPASVVEAGDVMKDVEKSPNLKPKLGIIYSSGQEKQNLSLELKDTKRDNEATTIDLPWKEDSGAVEFRELPHSRYTASVGDVELPDMDLQSGGVFILAYVAGGVPASSLIQLSKPNTVHMMWQIPQILIITVAEIMFSISGLEFAFTQAPVSMKSVVSAAWLLTVAFGNVIVAVVAEAKLFDRQMYEFLVFALLMVLDSMVFIYFAYIYKYADIPSEGARDVIDEKPAVTAAAYQDAA